MNAPAAPPRKIRVLVVDDSAVMRRAITTTLAKDPRIEIAGTANNGRAGLEALSLLRPDVVTLDIEMPELDGLAALRELRKTHPRLPVIMFSSLTQRGAQATILALTAGASDYVGKPTDLANLGDAFRCLETELIPKIKLFGEQVLAQQEAASHHHAPTPAEVVLARPGRIRRGTIEAVCIGVSTGGPMALVQLFSAWAEPLTVPLLIVQHMPATFTTLLAQRLTSVGVMDVQEAQDGDLVEPGRAYLAPGGRHMEVVHGEGVTRLRITDEAPENSCRPAADVLFRSAAQVYGGGLLGVVLTGMGCDGLKGCQAIRARGGNIVAQDEATSVVWGMPGAVAKAGLADAVLPLNEIPAEIVRVTRPRLNF
ncbi:MAG: two-component system chemotaxis family response regulator CheB [Limisphaerales bacterium]|nr:MAG: two-component system chemotaxis family response regulator CheB [Limisphaerales bacterium]KAG0509232.1 MAG: two-component system chemotaxis family response regulator CheB [Limisphaerales bacterium]TXT52229.1 MAG: two-component system chemotaxis family response regulator CheB [Limisphaerales bacterium]